MTKLGSKAFHNKIKERLIEGKTFLISMSSFFLKSNDNV